MSEPEVIGHDDAGQPIYRGLDLATVKPTRGWGWPALAKKAHYFVDGRSLCMEWLYMGALENGGDNSPDNCTACVKRHAPMVSK